MPFACLNIGLLLCLTLLLSCSNAMFLQGTKSRNDDEGGSDGEDTATATNTDQSKEGDGVDTPVWINASYLTCAVDAVKTSSDKVAVTCQLDGSEDPNHEAASAELVWAAFDAEGNETGETNEEDDRDDSVGRRFYFAPTEAASRFVGVKLGTMAWEHGAKVELAKSVSELKVGSSVRKCLENSASAASACIKLATGKLLMFVTSRTFDGSMGEAAGANTECDVAASEGHFSGKFVALVSTANQNMIDLVAEGVPIVQASDGVILSNSKTELLDGHKGSAPLKDEQGKAVESNRPVWTATNSLGTFREGADCSGWKSDLANVNGVGGLTGKSGIEWFVDERTVFSCNDKAHLYCIQSKPSKD